MTATALPLDARQGAVTAVVSPSGAANSLLRVLLANGPSARRGDEWSISARQSLCFVPEAVPVLRHLSASGNVRHLCALSGSALPTASAITHALRVCDLPDQRIPAKGGALSGLERLAVWLAAHRLRGTPTLLVEAPIKSLGPEELDAVIRLLREAATIPSAVLVTTRDAAFARSVADHVVTASEG